MILASFQGRVKRPCDATYEVYHIEYINAEKKVLNLSNEFGQYISNDSMKPNYIKVAEHHINNF